jgi:predicted  nucleic acid-binding Zn-ribbon protein
VNTEAHEVIDPDFNPYDLLEELAHELVRLNDRQNKLEKFFQELVEQHHSIANHMGGQTREVQKIYHSIGHLLNEIKQSPGTDSTGSN